MTFVNTVIFGTVVAGDSGPKSGTGSRCDPAPNVQDGTSEPFAET